jgi:YHS domain-containing protein
MFSILVRIFSAIFLIWMFRRLLAVFLGKSKINQPNRPAAPSNHMVKDPVCGMYMDSRLAVRLQGKHEEVFFCSEDCKEKYLNQSTGPMGASAPMENRDSQ